MKSPRQPIKPSEPKKPEKEYLELRRKSFSFYEGDNLEEIIKKANSLQILDFSKIIFQNSHDFDDGNYYSFIGEIKEKVVLTDEEFNKAYKKYNQQLAIYNIKLNNYFQLLNAYKTAKLEYEDWKQKQDEIKEKSILAKLLKKYQKENA